MSKVWVGIDIGKSGAIVAIKKNEVVVDKIVTYPMPKVGTEIDLVKLQDIFSTIRNSGEVFAVAEDVHSIFGTGAKSNFQFGRSLGIIEGMLAANNIPFQKVTPKKWQAECFVGVPVMKKPGKREEGRGSLDTKAMALLAAQRLYPNVDLRKSERAKVPDNGIVDALLMAHYCKQKF